MENELIYIIGEFLIMELDEVEEVTYPKDYEPGSMRIDTKGGKSYQLIIKAIV